MKIRHKIVSMLLLLSLTAIMFFPTSNNTVLIREDDLVNPSSITRTLDGKTPAGINDPYIDTVPVVEDVNVIDAAPDTNFNDDGGLGGIYLGRHVSGYYSRGWFKFDLPAASSTYQITRARMFVYLENEYSDLVDAAIGAYYSTNDSWDETTLTWNTQPSVDAVPLDVIDSPASTGMFVELNYYSWDVTSAASESSLDDSILSVMLKQENESITYSTFKYFVEREYFSAHAAYLELEWHVVPATSSFNGTIPVTEDAPIIDQAPDTNYNDNGGLGGIFLGRHVSGYYSRGWFKFNLSEVPDSLHITSARMFVYLENEYGDLVDASIGAYSTSNNSWTETTLTWNNQPSVDTVSLDVIDSPASPNMFEELNYYSWDVTSAATSALRVDDILSVMLKQENESITYSTFKYFVEREYLAAHAAYLQFEWQEGELQNVQLQVIEEETVYDSQPDTNLDGNLVEGGIFVGRHTSGAYGRGWFKFDISDVPSSFALSSARMFVYLEHEYPDLVDAPIGAYYSNDDSWSETTITWNNQPSSDGNPLDLIDSPASTGMFVELNYYSWDVTSAVSTSLLDDGILSVVLRQENESIDYNTFKYFVEREYNSNHSAYLELEWHTPATSTPTVDGYSQAPYVDYISNPNPEFGWDFIDSDIDESQTNYEAELHDEGANRIWNKNQSYYASVFNQGTDQNARPFSTPSEMKFQFKYPSSLIPNSGLIDKLYFDIDLDTAVVSYSNFTLFMLSMHNDTALSTDFTGNYDGGNPKVVFFSTEYYPEIRNGQLIIDIWNNFFVNKNMDLLIEIKYTSATGPTISSNHSLASTGSVAYTYGSGAYSNGTAEYTYGRTHNLYLDYASDVVSEGGTYTHAYPFNATHPLTMQMKYNKSLLEHNGFIDRLYFRVDNIAGSLTLHNFTLSLLESPLEGPLGYNFTSNYQGATPVKVLDQVSYEVSYENYWLAIDIPDIFYYSGINDLLIELRFTSITGALTFTYMNNSFGVTYGGRAYGPTVDFPFAVWVDDYAPDLVIDFVYPESAVTYDGPTLINGTTYTLSVRTRDTLGIWSSWSKLNFTFNIFGFAPHWINLFRDADVISLGASDTYSIDVHHPEGIGEVLFYCDGINHTMTNSSNTYSYTWTPTVLGSNPYTIYMSSTLGYWNTTSGILTVVDGTNPSVNSVERNPLTPSDVESVTITANVTDQFGISTVILYYNDGSQTFDVTMSPSGPMYEAIIPALPRGTNVLYQIYVNDTSNNLNTSSLFGYTVLQSAPLWSDLIESSGTIELGESVTVSIDVSHSIGVSSVLLETSGSNYTMQNISGTYNWTWTPDAVGLGTYVVYMLSDNGYWNTTSGSIDVSDTTDPIVVFVSGNPLSPTDADTVTITAMLTDLGGFQEVLVQYDIGSGWVNISMSISGSVYTGVIPVFPSETVVTYRVYAIDPSGNWVLSLESEYTVASSSTTSTTTTSTTTSTTTTAQPQDSSLMILALGGVAGVGIIAVLVFSMKRKKS